MPVVSLLPCPKGGSQVLLLASLLRSSPGPPGLCLGHFVVVTFPVKLAQSPHKHHCAVLGQLDSGTQHFTDVVGHDRDQIISFNLLGEICRLGKGSTPPSGPPILVGHLRLPPTSILTPAPLTHPGTSPLPVQTASTSSKVRGAHRHPQHIRHPLPSDGSTQGPGPFLWGQSIGADD